MPKEAISQPTRLIDGTRIPSKATVASFVGKHNAARWATLAEFIDANYPGIFHVEWLFGGKHGWYLRYKKSKSFCSFIPERGQFCLLMVFGAAERERVEAILSELKSHVQEDYQKSPTYHDGKWVLVNVDSAKVLTDIKKLLLIKRPLKARRPTS